MDRTSEQPWQSDGVRVGMSSQRTMAQKIWRIGFLLPLVCGLACNASPPLENTSGNGPGTRESGDGSELVGTTWNAMFVQGKKVGYSRLDTELATDNGSPILRREATMEMRLRRFGDTNTPRTHYVSVETPDGKLLSFGGEEELGDTPRKVRGEVLGDDTLEIQIEHAGQEETRKLEWNPAIGGFSAEQDSLLRKPLQPQERRRLRALVPFTYEIATIEMQAMDFEETALLDGSKRLLRIEVTSRSPSGGRMDSTLWADETGQIFKRRDSGLELETFLVDERTALAEASPADTVDLGKLSMIRVDARLPQGLQTQRATYRVTLREGNPAEVFPSTERQQVTPVDVRTADISITSSSGSASNTESSPPTDEDLQPNSLIQSNHPSVLALANRFPTAGQPPLATALDLEKFVHASVRSKNFSQAFATAAEVAQNMEGDCTEHAVLLAALARAKGIPARVAIGLVYMPSEQAFGYHMWNDLYIDGEWLPFDATLGQGGIGAAHLKLSQSNLAGVNAYGSFLPAAQVMGQLDIEILEAGD